MKREQRRTSERETAEMWTKESGEPNPEIRESFERERGILFWLNFDVATNFLFSLVWMRKPQNELYYKYTQNYSAQFDCRNTQTQKKNFFLPSGWHCCCCVWVTLARAILTDHKLIAHHNPLLNCCGGSFNFQKIFFAKCVVCVCELNFFFTSRRSQNAFPFVVVNLPACFCSAVLLCWCVRVNFFFLFLFCVCVVCWLFAVVLFSLVFFLWCDEGNLLCVCVWF